MLRTLKLSLEGSGGGKAPSVFTPLDPWNLIFLSDVNFRIVNLVYIYSTEIKFPQRKSVGTIEEDYRVELILESGKHSALSYGFPVSFLLQELSLLHHPCCYLVQIFIRVVDVKINVHTYEVQLGLNQNVYACMQ